MKLHLLTAGAAMLALSAGAASAATHSSTYAEPSQPIAYSKLDAYLKATPSQRARRDWTNGGAAAAIGTASNTSAIAPASAPMGASPTLDNNNGDTTPAAPLPPDKTGMPTQSFSSPGASPAGTDSSPQPNPSR